VEESFLNKSQHEMLHSVWKGRGLEFNWEGKWYKAYTIPLMNIFSHNFQLGELTSTILSLGMKGEANIPHLGC